MGEKQHEPFQFTFNRFLKVAFKESRVTSDAGLVLIRELDERLGLAILIAEHLSDTRHGLDTRVFPRSAGAGNDAGFKAAGRSTTKNPAAAGVRGWATRFQKSTKSFDAVIPSNTESDVPAPWQLTTRMSVDAIGNPADFRAGYAHWR